MKITRRQIIKLLQEADGKLDSLEKAYFDRGLELFQDENSKTFDDFNASMLAAAKELDEEMGVSKYAEDERRGQTSYAEKRQADYKERKKRQPEIDRKRLEMLQKSPAYKQRMERESGYYQSLGRTFESKIRKMIREAIAGEEPSITTRDHRGSVTSYRRPREEDPGDTGPTDYTVPQASLRNRRKQFMVKHLDAVLISLGIDHELSKLKTNDNKPATKEGVIRAKIVDLMNQNNSFVVQTVANPPTLFFSTGFRFPDGEAAVANLIQRQVTHAVALDGTKINDNEIGKDVVVDITNPESLRLGDKRENVSENKIKVTRSQLTKLLEGFLNEAKSYKNEKRIKNVDDLQDYFSKSIIDDIKNNQIAFVAYKADADGEAGLNELREFAESKFEKENPDTDYRSKVKIPEHVLVYEDK